MKLILDKLTYSIFASILMYIIANPTTYQMIDNSFEEKGKISDAIGCPTLRGHLLHTVIFFILVFASMLIFLAFKPMEEQKSLGLILKYSFYTALIFFLITSKEMYEFVNSMLKCFGFGSILEKEVCPSMDGVIVHSFIFGLIMFGVMNFPRDVQLNYIYTQ